MAFHFSPCHHPTFQKLMTWLKEYLHVIKLQLKKVCCHLKNGNNALTIIFLHPLSCFKCGHFCINGGYMCKIMDEECNMIFFLIKDQSVWIPFITENWKYYNKIIFKCVNSTMGPNFEKKFTELDNLWVSWTVHGTHYIGPKRTETEFQCNSNGGLVINK